MFYLFGLVCLYSTCKNLSVPPSHSLCPQEKNSIIILSDHINQIATHQIMKNIKELKEFNLPQLGNVGKHFERMKKKIFNTMCKKKRIICLLVCQYKLMCIKLPLNRLMMFNRLIKFKINQNLLYVIFNIINLGLMLYVYLY